MTKPLRFMIHDSRFNWIHDLGLVSQQKSLWLGTTKEISSAIYK